MGQRKGRRRARGQTSVSTGRRAATPTEGLHKLQAKVERLRCDALGSGRGSVKVEQLALKLALELERYVLATGKRSASVRRIRDFLAPFLADAHGRRPAALADEGTGASQEDAAPSGPQSSRASSGGRPWQWPSVDRARVAPHSGAPRDKLRVGFTTNKGRPIAPSTHVHEVRGGHPGLGKRA